MVKLVTDLPISSLHSKKSSFAHTCIVDGRVRGKVERVRNEMRMRLLQHLPRKVVPAEIWHILPNLNPWFPMDARQLLPRADKFAGGVGERV